MTPRFLAVLFCCLWIGATPVVRGAAILYGATGSSGVAGALYTIDPVNAAATLVGPIVNAADGAALSITGLAFSPLSGVLFGVTSNSLTPNIPRTLVTINPQTAAATVIGSLGGSGVGDIAFAANGNLYGYQNGGMQALLSINLSTGLATTVGSSATGTTKGGGIAFSPSGTLHVSASGAVGTLDRVDVDTGVRTVGVTLNGANAIAGETIAAMSFDDDGTLFGVINNRLGGSDRLVVINPNTGGMTAIGVLPPGFDAIAFQAVPEPESCALLLIGLVALGRRIRATHGHSAFI